MPNWNFNNIALIGKSAHILAFLNTGLRNSHLEEADEYSYKLIETLNEQGKTRARDLAGGLNGNGSYKVTESLGLTLRTFTPMPDIYLEFDTDNCASTFPNAVRQQRHHGAVGIIGYNLKTLGCKWNAELTIEKCVPSDNGNGCMTLHLYCETPYACPAAWIKTICHDFGLDCVALSVDEFMSDAEITENGRLIRRFVTESGDEDDPADLEAVGKMRAEYEDLVMEVTRKTGS